MLPDLFLSLFVGAKYTVDFDIFLLANCPARSVQTMIVNHEMNGKYPSRL